MEGADRRKMVRVRSVKIKTHPMSLGVLLVPYDLHDMNDLQNPSAKLNPLKDVTEE